MYNGAMGDNTTEDDLTESEYLETMMLDFGLTPDSTIGELLEALREDEDAEDDE